MYAVIETGGKQHRVEVGEVVQVERTGAELGAKVVFDRVLMVGDGSAVRVGSPSVEGATVRGTVLELDRAKKVLTYQYRRRQNSSRKRRGHRQDYMAVKIDAIQG
ncbi:MAG TPA: 50S ribosomal protein L21 [Candidatus Polarisedimenticolaceae bacterium]|jgi:large subunit ribosomal protein L21